MRVENKNILIITTGKVITIGLFYRLHHFIIVFIISMMVMLPMIICISIWMHTHRMAKAFSTSSEYNITIL